MNAQKKVRSSGKAAVQWLSRISFRMNEVRLAKRMRESWRRPWNKNGTDTRQQTLSEVERNIKYLYLDVFAAAIFMAVMAFNTTFALRLGASNQMVGWLSSIPSLFAVVMMIPAARFLENKSDQAPWINWSLLIGRLMFLLVAFIPWIVNRFQAEIVVWILILRSIPMNFFSAGFSPMLAKVIPARDRARVLGNRSSINSAVVAVSTFLIGLWLDAGTKIKWASFPLNYQLIFILGAMAALLSVYYVSRVKTPPSRVHKNPIQLTVDKIDRRTSKINLTQMLKENKAFVRMVVNTLIFNLGAWFVMSLYSIFFIKELQASDSWVGLNTTLANVGVIIGNLIWRRIISKVGENKALLYSLPMSALYALLVAIFPDLKLILLWGILINIINPGVNLSHYNILVDLCPQAHLTSFMAVFSTVMNIGAFVSPMLGIALSEMMDIRWVLVIGGIIRLFGAFMFFIWKVNAPHYSYTQTADPA